MRTHGIFLAGAAAAIALIAAPATAQQIPDTAFAPPIGQPEYDIGDGPTVFIDAAHFNFHTADGRYLTFANLLRRDGYLVESNHELFTRAALERADVLVISNAMHQQSELDFAPLPNLSAFTADEIAAVEVDPLARIGIKDGEFVIRPFYQQISQTGVDLLLVTGKWIWKFEGIYRDASVSTNYYAMVGGLEYIFDGIGGTGMDLGVFLEYLYDDRGDELSVTEDDFFVGLRWAFNDVRGTSILVGVTQDVDTDVRFPVLKASTRLDSHWRLSMEYRGLMNQTREDIFYDLREDDFFQMELAYHF